MLSWFSTSYWSVRSQCPVLVNTDLGYGSVGRNLTFLHVRPQDHLYDSRCTRLLHWFLSKTCSDTVSKKKTATSTESYPIYEPVLIFQGDTWLEPILPHTVFWSHFVLGRKRKLSMIMFHLIYVVSIQNLLVQPLTWLNTCVIFFGTVPRNLDQSSLTFPNRCLLPRGSRNRSISAISESTGGCWA